MIRYRKFAVVAATFSALVFVLLSGCAAEKERLQKQVLACQQRLAALERENGDLRTTVGAKDAEIAELNTRIQTLDREKQALASQHDRAAAEAAKQENALKQLAGALEKLGCKTSMRGDDLVVNLAADGELFDPGQVTLTADARTRVAAVGRLLGQQARDCLICVVGHSDSTPVVRLKEAYPTNYELSFARARAVQAQLMAGTGLAEKNVFPASRAEFAPIADNRTPGGRSRNRRVELVISPARP